MGWGWKENGRGRGMGEWVSLDGWMYRIVSDGIVLKGGREDDVWKGEDEWIGLVFVRE